MAASGLGGEQMEIPKILEIPEDCTCPISKMPMKDPVMCADGHSYERELITEWFRMGHSTSPKTNLRLSDTSLVDNINLRNVIQSLTDRMPEIQRLQLQQERAQRDIGAVLEALGEGQDKQLRSLAPPGTPSAQEPGQGSENSRAISDTAGAPAHGSSVAQEEAAEDLGMPSQTDSTKICDGMRMLTRRRLPGDPKPGSAADRRDDTRRKGADKLYRLAQRNDTNKRAVCQAAGALEALVTMMGANVADIKAEHAAVRALDVLAELPENRPSIRSAGAEVPAERLRHRRKADFQPNAYFLFHDHDSFIDPTSDMADALLKKLEERVAETRAQGVCARAQR